jgi:hypothetical protein
MQQNEEPRASAQPEVNEAPVRIQENCTCGSTYKVQMPAEFRADALKGVNTWRKYHACGWKDMVPVSAGVVNMDMDMDNEVPDSATEQAHTSP